MIEVDFTIRPAVGIKSGREDSPNPAFGKQSLGASSGSGASGEVLSSSGVVSPIITARVPWMVEQKGFRFAVTRGQGRGREVLGVLHSEGTARQVAWILNAA